MSKFFFALVVCLLSFVLSSASLYATEAPIVDIITGTTGRTITTTVLQETPTHRFDVTNLAPLPQVDILVTATTQINRNKGFLFGLDVDRNIEVSKIDITGLQELQVGTPQKFGLKTTEFYGALQASQSAEQNAIAVFTKEQYRAVRFNKNGHNARRFTQIYPVFPDVTFSFSGGASADFRFSWHSGVSNNTVGFYGIARLTPKLKIDGNPFGISGPVIISGDVTNDLNGQRIFFYREVVGPEKDGRFPTRIMGQRFNSVTPGFIGAPFAVTKSNFTPFIQEEGIQSVAVDPGARFVAYTSFSKTCGKEILKFRLLDDQFKPSGKAKTLLGCDDLKDSNAGVFGLDVLRFNF